jgi:methyl-accepting chemotaxis protein
MAFGNKISIPVMMAVYLATTTILTLYIVPGTLPRPDDTAPPGGGFMWLAPVLVPFLLLLAANLLLVLDLRRRVFKPLAALGPAIRDLGKSGKPVEIPGPGCAAEIDDLARIVETRGTELIAGQRENRDSLIKSAACDGTSACLMIIDSGLVIRAVNTSLSRGLEKHPVMLQGRGDAIDPAGLIGQPVAVFPELQAHLSADPPPPANIPFRIEITRQDANFSLDISMIAENGGWVVEWRDTSRNRIDAAIIRTIDALRLTAEFGLDGVMIGANSGFSDLTGIKGQPDGPRVGDLFELDDPDAEGKSIWKMVVGGEPAGRRFRLAGRSGPDIFLEGTFYPVTDICGETILVLFIGTDVTKDEARARAASASRSELETEQAGIVQALKTGLRHLSDGDLTTGITGSFRPEYEPLRDDFNRAVRALQDAMLRVVENADSIRGEAADISSAADDLSGRTEHQAATLEETAAALDELTVNVRTAADSATLANRVVSEAKTNAETSSGIVREAVLAMGEIEASSGKISRIIGVIDDIAFQTNLLALNAGVEAERAGESGRGFAVVGSEVRALAGRSADAAREINELISVSSQNVRRGVDLVGQTGRALEEIIGSVSNISSHMSGIAVSAREQSAGLVEINTAINRLDQVTQQNAAMFEETTAASHSLTREAAVLARTMGRFKTGRQAPSRGGNDDAAQLDEMRSPDGSQEFCPPPRAVNGRNAGTEDNLAWKDF